MFLWGDFAVVVGGGCGSGGWGSMCAFVCVVVCVLVCVFELLIRDQLWEIFLYKFANKLPSSYFAKLYLVILFFKMSSF